MERNWDGFNRIVSIHGKQSGQLQGGVLTKVIHHHHKEIPVNIADNRRHRPPAPTIYGSHACSRRCRWFSPKPHRPWWWRSRTGPRRTRSLQPRRQDAPDNVDLIQFLHCELLTSPKSVRVYRACLLVFGRCLKYQFCCRHQELRSQ
jgi:hypothetical protein